MDAGSTIGVITPLVSGPYFGMVVAGVLREAEAAGARAVVVQTLDPRVDDDAPGIPEVTTRLGWARLDALVSVTLAAPAAHLAHAAAEGLPIVLVSHEVPGLPVPSVIPDNEGGIRRAVEHLHAHGHRRIAFVGHPRQADVAARQTAFRRVMAELGLADDAVVIDSLDFVESGGEHAGRALVEDRSGVTAVVAGNDLNALGVVTAVRRAGWRVPEDLAVVGFDDTPSAEHREPGLTSVNQNVEAVGALAARLALDAVAGRPAPAGRYLVPTSLVVRESCGCTPGATLPAPPDAPHLAVEGRLAARLEAALVTARGDDVAPDAVHRACVDLAAAVVAALDGPVPGSRLRAAARVLHAYRPRGETVSAVLAVVQEAVDHHAAGGGSVTRAGAVVGDVVRAISDARTGDQARTALHLQEALRQEFDISMELLRGREHPPASLRWLRHAPVQAGMLALWSDDRHGGLRVASTSGDVEAEVGEELLAEEFPPVALVEAAARHPGSAVVVLPVRTEQRDWGLLALVGPPERRTATGRETYFQWAAMLGVALDQEAMLESLRSQREEIARAYRRERDLAESIRRSEERYALASSATNDGLWDWDLVADRTYYSPRWKAMLGHAEGEVGSTPAEWLGRVHPEDLPGLSDVLARCRRGELASFEHEHRMVHADGAHRRVLCRALAVPGDGTPAARVVGSMSDVTESRALEDQLRRQALYDGLTGLPNRTLLLDRLERAITRAARRPDEQFAVLFLDLDGFKVVNDSLGHRTGDLLLREVARRIADGLRASDTAARLGGDEFTVLLEGVTDLEVVEGLAAKLQATLAEPYEVEGRRLVVSASVGVTTSAFGYGSAQDVLRDADIAMYRAKTRRRGSSAVFDRSMHDSVVARLQVESDLRRAVDDGAFGLRFQPVVRLGTGQVTGFEALVRWRRGDGAEVGPEAFLAVAEETGLVVPMGRLVVDEACRTLQEWRATGDVPGVVPVGVNVSHREFWDDGTVDALVHRLERHGLGAEWLTLEVTEHVLMADVEGARRRLEELHAVGVRVHVDDYGTGFSSLDALHRFPIDALKIDRSFVARLEGDPRSRELVSTIVVMARALEIDVVAEGVETAAQQEILVGLGCERGQGDLFASPVPADEALALLRADLALVRGDAVGPAPVA